MRARPGGPSVLALLSAVCIPPTSCIYVTLEGHCLVLTFTIAHFNVSDKNRLEISGRETHEDSLTMLHNKINLGLHLIDLYRDESTHLAY